jgi:hypothetical protein
VLPCKDNKAAVKEGAIAKQGAEYTSAYVCPVHCKDSGSDKEVACNTCGMTLMKNEDHAAKGHKHE